MSQIFIFSFWVKVSNSIGRRFSFKLFGSTVNTIIINNKNGSSKLISCQSFALHSTKTKSTVSHHWNCPQLRITRSCRNHCRKTNAHCSKSSCIKLASRKIVLEYSSSNIHCICSFSNKNSVFRNVILDNRVRGIVSHGYNRVSHQFFVHLFVLLTYSVQLFKPIFASYSTRKPFIELGKSELKISN